MTLGYLVALILDGQQLPLDRAAFSLVIHASSELDPDQDCPVMFDRLATALRDVDRVVIACLPERRLSWVRMLKGANIRSELIAPELMEVAPLALDSYGDLPTMVVADGPLGKFDTAIKRSFDIAVSALGLLLFSLPMLIIVVLIKLSRVGPILFVQTRIGQGNRQFRMFKFRSMRVEQGDHSGHRSAGRDDERITPIGRFMRLVGDAENKMVVAEFGIALLLFLQSGGWLRRKLLDRHGIGVWPVAGALVDRAGAADAAINRSGGCACRGGRRLGWASCSARAAKAQNAFLVAPEAVSVFSAVVTLSMATTPLPDDVHPPFPRRGNRTRRRARRTDPGRRGRADRRRRGVEG